MKTPMDTYYELASRDLRANARWKTMRRLAWGAVVAVVLTLCVLILFSGEKDDKNVVPVVRITGEIGPALDIDSLHRQIERAMASSKSGIILAIDSPGGDPNHAVRIKHRIASVAREFPEKKVVAVCERLCASAGYMIALEGSVIAAGPYSLVGSIGAVLMNGNFSDLLNKVGVTYKAYASGPYKAMLNPYIPSTAANEEKAMQIVKTLGARFSSEVRERRKLSPAADIDGGEVWTTDVALEMKLIDEVAVIEDVAEKHFAGARPVVVKRGRSLPTALQSVNEWLAGRVNLLF